MLESPRTILILASNPINTERARLDAELSAIDEGLKRATHREQFTLATQLAARPEVIQRALLDHSPKIVHFAGHGAGSAGIFLENEQGKAVLVAGEALSELFALFENVACVVLNACYTEEQAAAIAQYVPYVVGMSDQISDQAAMRFAVAFYDAIGANRSYPFAFRLGCNAIKLAGLDEDLVPILYAKDEVENAEQSLFISFALRDEAWVEGFLLDALDTAGMPTEAQLLHSPVQSESDILPSNFPTSAQFLLVVSSSYPLAEVVPHLSRRFGRDATTWPVRLLMLESVQLPPDAASLLTLNATDAHNWAKVVDRLCRDLAHGPAQNATALACPYPGMQPFNELNSHHFYGRDAEIELLRSYLRLNSFMAVIGPSGSGKSSLVMAGLVPALRRPSAFFGPGHWIIRDMRPGVQPLSALKQTLDGLVDPETWQPLKREGAVALDRILLVVDQFEETFTFAEAEQIRPFQEALLKLMAAPTCYVVITVRADFYVDLMSSRLWPAVSKHRLEVLPLKEDGLRSAIVRPAINSGVYIEESLVTQLLEDAAEEPGVLPFVQETMFLLWQKLERRFLPETAYDQLSDGAQSGLKGLYLAMTQRANSTLNGLTTEQEAIARRILLRLIQFGEGRADTRRQQPVNELLAHHEDKVLFEETLSKLTNQRLLTLSAQEDPAANSGERKVDIAHESLLNGWPQLRRWIDERRAAEQARRRLEDKAGEWVRLGRGEGGLLTAAALAEAEEWLHSVDAEELGFSQDLADLVDQSRQTLDALAIEERRTRRTRLLMASALGLLIMLLLSGAWWVQRQNALQQLDIANKERQAAEEADRLRLEADNLLIIAQENEQIAYEEKTRAEAERHNAQVQERISRANQFAAQAELAYVNQSERVASFPLLFASEAVRTTWITDSAIITAPFTTEAANRALRRAVNAASPWRMTLPPHYHAATIPSVVFSPDGQTVATASADHTAGIWDVTTGQQVLRLIGHSAPLRAIDYSHNGEMVATTSEDRTIRLWNAGNGELMHTLVGHFGTVLMASFSPDDQTLVSAGSDNVARLWDVASGTELLVLEGHDGSVNAAVFSPDGKMIVTAGDNVGRLWSVETGETISQFEGHEDRVLWADFHPDGSFVVSVGRDQTARLWEVTTGAEVRQFVGHEDHVRFVNFSPDGKMIVTTSTDGTARLWDVESGEQLHRFAGYADNLILFADFSPDSQTIAMAGQDRTVHVWDVENGAILQQLGGHIDEVLATQFSPNGQIVATAGKDQTVRLWEVASGQEIRVLWGYTDTIRTIDFSQDSAMLATAGDDHIVTLWDVHDGQKIQEFAGHRDSVRNVIFASDDHTIISASMDGTIRLWAVDTGLELGRLSNGEDSIQAMDFRAEEEALATLDFEQVIHLWDLSAMTETHRFSTDVGNLSAIRFSPNGEQIFTGGVDGVIRLWSLTSGRELRSFVAHDGAVHSIALSADGGQLLTGGDDWTVRLWNTVTHREVNRFEGHSAPVWSVTFSPDNQTILSASADRTARIWNVASTLSLPTLVNHTDDVNWAIFSPDNTTIVTASQDESVRMWDAASGAEIRRFEGHEDEVAVVAMSSDGHFIASASDDTMVHLWDANTGALMRTLQGHEDEVAFVAISPDDKLIATSSDDTTVRLWDVETGQQLYMLADHIDAGKFVTFSPDGKSMLSAGEDGIMYLWDVATGHEITKFVGHGDRVLYAEFDSDGEIIVSASEDQTARVWDVSTQAEIHRFQHTAQVNTATFSPDEKAVVTANEDQTIQFWNMETGHKFRHIADHTDEVNSVFFSHDGRFIVSTSNDLTAQMWYANVDELLRHADSLIQKEPPILAAVN